MKLPQIVQSRTKLRFERTVQTLPSFIDRHWWLAQIEADEVRKYNLSCQIERENRAAEAIRWLYGISTDSDNEPVVMARCSKLG